MIIWALAAALVLDTTPGTEVPYEAKRPRLIEQEASPAPLLTVAVTLECTARANGRVENCRVLGETHPGFGFAEAAVALMQDAEVDPGPEDFQFARTIQFTP